MKRLLDLIAQRVSWHRRAVGAVLAAAAVLMLGNSLAPAEGPTEPAVVISADLPAGHVLTASDVSLAHLPSHSVPDGALTEADALVGRSTAVSLGGGTVLQPGMLAASRNTEPGRALVPIVLRDDNLRSLLNPGDRISLIATGYDEVEILTTDARVAVLATPPSGGSPLASVSANSGPMILVDVPTSEAPMVAALGQDGGLRIVLGGAPG
ncbi:SAF domain-containing protein [Tessaracoccus sp. MC1756]|uniref:SAF domain-containing protein n=1 Tax=Tessaracoccus sp. MC1756 TaxID=2760311 RepID=UPI00160111FA|nr:SAF domain-containing protein [Tessaracoccus sp. MC1756]MBB1509716.1 flagella basal body P-ring formation protein FlgA [Tessaracoccus sp. MC1756]